MISLEIKEVAKMGRYEIDGFEVFTMDDGIETIVATIKGDSYRSEDIARKIARDHTKHYTFGYYRSVKIAS